jgi:hypothetical protein
MDGEGKRMGRKEQVWLGLAGEECNPRETRPAQHEQALEKRIVQK